MVGGDDPGAAARAQRLKDAAEARVDGFDGRMVASSLPEWPTMSALAKFMTMASNSPFSMALITVSAIPCGGHFGLQIVGGDFRRGHEDAFFAAKGLFHAAIEKISDVRVFFGLRDAQIAQVLLGENLRENVLEFFRRKKDSAARKSFCRTGSWRRRRDFSAARDRRTCRSRLGNGAGHLARAVGAKIEKNDGIVVANGSYRRGGWTWDRR